MLAVPLRAGREVPSPGDRQGTCPGPSCSEPEAPRSLPAPPPPSHLPDSGLSRASAAMVLSLPCVDPSAPVLSQALRQEQRPSTASQPAFLHRLHHPPHPVLEMPLFLVPLFSNFIQSWNAEKSSTRRQRQGHSPLSHWGAQVWPDLGLRCLCGPGPCLSQGPAGRKLSGGHRRGWLSRTFSLSEARLWPPPSPNFLIFS